MAKWAVWSAAVQLLPLLVGWLVLMLATGTWLRDERLPIHPAAWSLFFVLVANLAVSASATLVVGLAGLAAKPQLFEVVSISRVGLTILTWVVLSKVFFPGASVSRLALTAVVGAGAQAFLILYLDPWLLHLRGVLRGA